MSDYESEMHARRGYLDDQRCSVCADELPKRLCRCDECRVASAASLRLFVADGMLGGFGDLELPQDPRAPWITLASGTRLTVLLPRVEQIRIEDMALGLAREPRFSGQTRDDCEPYSVAQHSVLASWMVAPAYAAWALLHDGAEGVGYRDIAAPFKRSAAMAGYRDAEAFGLRCVFAAFGLSGEMPGAVKAVDAELLAVEKRFLMPPLQDGPIPAALVPWPWRVARQLFIERARELGLRHVVHGAVA